MATTTVTPTSATSEQPKLLKKASESSTPITPTQLTFGCQHIKGLLQARRDQATEGYTKLITSLRDPDNISSRSYKSGESVKSTSGTTYLCLQCPNVSCSRAKHRKEHAFSVESNHGFIFCHECKDFVYDPTFEEIRSSNGKKRKQGPTHAEGDKRLIANNTTATPCAATGLRGLYNMGQTCFMSVIIQSLVHNPLIRTYYLAEGHKSTDCNREACTSCALDEIFTEFFGQEKHEGYGAVHMLQGCWKNGGGLAGYSQQDAHEYLGFILNSLHTANTAEDEEGENGAKKHTLPKDCDCAIHQTFGGLLRSTVTCSKCKNTTTAHDPFMDLSLDIRNSAVITKKKKLALTNGTQTIKETAPMDLSECLDRFTAAETLSSDSYKCRKCGGPQEAKKKLSLSRLPPVIPIHLKRFSHNKMSATSSKVETKIRFPFALDLTPYVTASSSKSKDGTKPNTANVTTAKAAESSATDKPPLYELSSVVVHKGKLDNGHYISYSRQQEEWFRFDDSMVVQVDEKEVLGAEAYMLFYVLGEIEGDAGVGGK